MIFANTTCKGPSKKGPKGFDVFRLLRKHAVLMHRHIPTAILLLLMIVLFVAMDETFLPQLLTALAVDVGEPRAALRQGVVLEDICHVMEQPRHGKEHLRRCRSTLPLKGTARSCAHAPPPWSAIGCPPLCHARPPSLGAAAFPRDTAHEDFRLGRRYRCDP